MPTLLITLTIVVLSGCLPDKSKDTKQEPQKQRESIEYLDDVTHNTPLSPI